MSSNAQRGQGVVRVDEEPVSANSATVANGFFTNWVMSDLSGAQSALSGTVRVGDASPLARSVSVERAESAVVPAQVPSVGEICPEQTSTVVLPANFKPPQPSAPAVAAPPPPPAPPAVAAAPAARAPMPSGSALEAVLPPPKPRRKTKKESTSSRSMVVAFFLAASAGAAVAAALYVALAGSM